MTMRQDLPSELQIYLLHNGQPKSLSPNTQGNNPGELRHVKVARLIPAGSCCLFIVSNKRRKGCTLVFCFTSSLFFLYLRF
jgi:hypothetical protein